MLKECIPGSIHFMSPTREFQLIKDVLKVAKGAKENKLGIYGTKKIEVHCIKAPNFAKYEQTGVVALKKQGVSTLKFKANTI